MYNCAPLDLFELGSNPYPFYLINIRLPVNQAACQQNPKAPNCAIGRINDLRIIVYFYFHLFVKIFYLFSSLELRLKATEFALLDSLFDLISYI